MCPFLTTVETRERLEGGNQHRDAVEPTAKATPKAGDTVKVKDAEGNEVEATVNADGTATTSDGKQIAAADVVAAVSSGGSSSSTAGGGQSAGNGSGSGSSSSPSSPAPGSSATPGAPSAPSTPSAPAQPSEPTPPADPHAGQTWVVDYYDQWVETSPAWDEQVGVRWYEGNNGMRWYNMADLQAYMNTLSMDEAEAFTYTIMPDIYHHPAEGYYEKVAHGGHWE